MIYTYKSDPEYPLKRHCLLLDAADIDRLFVEANKIVPAMYGSNTREHAQQKLDDIWLIPEIAPWLRENNMRFSHGQFLTVDSFDRENEILVNGRVGGRFYFFTKDDAMLFKLTWG